MISIEPRKILEVPTSLLKSDDTLNPTKVEEAFHKNITKKEYVDKNNLYKQSDVQQKLKAIYYNKCAYCELEFLERDMHIDHYRPKKSQNLSKCDGNYAYYWLAYSFSNLIPLCPSCNRYKSNCFDINASNRILFDAKKQDLESLHFVTQDYNKYEQPKLIHPEYDNDFEKYISYDRVGKMMVMIHANHNEADKDMIYRLRYSIKTCGLNKRRDLVKLRLLFVNDFIELLNASVLLFKTTSQKEDLQYFKSAIDFFKRHAKKDSEFLLLKRFLIHPKKIILLLRDKDTKVQRVIQKAILEYARDLLEEYKILQS